MKHEVATLQTKQMLSASLKRLMHKKLLSKITITDIITDCNVNRKTFYYHFADVSALFEWTLAQESEEIVAQFGMAIDLSEALLFVMEYMENNEYMVHSSLGAFVASAVRGFFYNDFVSMMGEMIRSAEDRTGVSLDEAYRSFLCSFYATAISGALFDWFREPAKHEKIEVCEKIHKTITKSLDGILRISDVEEELQ